MPNSAVDVMMAEFNALRAEILQCQQAQTFTFTAALAANAAIAGVAFAKEGRLEVLLLLPFVLEGLCLLYLNYVRRPLVLGSYIRERLWPKLRLEINYNVLPCWEEHLSSRHPPAEGGREGVPCVQRDEDASWYSSQRLLSAAPGLLVFIAPSFAVLILGPWEVIHKYWNAWSLFPWALSLGIMATCAKVYLRGPLLWQPELV